MRPPTGQIRVEPAPQQDPPLPTWRIALFDTLEEVAEDDSPAERVRDESQHEGYPVHWLGLRGGTGSAARVRAIINELASPTIKSLNGCIGMDSTMLINL